MPAQELMTVGPVLIVIDALDESAELWSRERTGLLNILSRRISEVPDNCRILITTRPEPDICKKFPRIPEAYGYHRHQIN